MRISTNPDALKCVDLGPASKIEIVALYDQDDTWIDIVDLNAGPCGMMKTVGRLEMGCLVDIELAVLALKYWVKTNKTNADETTTVPSARELMEV